MIHRFFALLALPMVVACTQTNTPSRTVASLPSPGTAAPVPAAGCAAEIGSFRAAIDSDKETGNIAGSVHRALASEADAASRACAAGQEGEALRRLASVKGRYGYR
jgi:hypothetical protein